MRLNSIKPAAGSKREHLRVGRGASAGQGKTCGRGVKGQRARKGGYHKVGFEGGQTPLDRRLPKFGFRSKIKTTRAEVRLDELAKVDAAVIDLEALKKAITAQVPLGRFGTAEEVASTVAFLASPQAAYLTGATTVVGGGFGTAVS